MFTRFWLIIKKMDWLLLVAVFLLIAFGLSQLYSLGLAADNNFNLLTKQIIFSVLGFVLVIFFLLFDYRWWRFLSPVVYAVSLTLLVLVLFFGQNVRGTTGWFVWASFSFQPVELAKLAVIFLLSYAFTSWMHQRGEWWPWIKSFLIILPVTVLALIQPDFGSMFIILVIWFGMLWLFGVNKKHLIYFLIILILVAGVSWQFLLYDYQKERVMSFINPELDPLGTGYNVRQSMIAIGSGGLFGRGLGLGTQSQLHFLPVSEADFIFASISEELGLIGAIFIFALYFVLFFRLFKIMRQCKDDFGLFLVFGLSLMFFVQLVINIGMTVGLLPVTGLPLPFVSYGGSFLVISLIGIGIVQSVKIRQ